MAVINVPIKESIIPMYDEPLRDILNHEHTHYVFAGGRGSTKSSFIGGIVIPLLIINNPTAHAVCFRKVGNTIQNSIFAQVVWGIYQLGLEKLFKIPKTYSSGITYRPTGQRIYFMGLDDPMKVKSIKPQFGYIGITWFEELDQFAGERELRTVLQSTMRGGELFWDFRTFNPPISKNNWANEYAEEAERNTNCLVIRNTYLDVPKSWLGDQFILEAEDLKQLNPRAYEHEYMGVPIGSGGDVFPNVSHLDMEQLVEVTSRSGEIVKKPLWRTFDKIYNGIDWGFAVDPFRFVRMHFDVKKLNLYIFSEYEAKRMRNKDIFDDLYINEKLISPSELVTADSAEPKSIADFRSYGAFIRPAEKGPDSVRYGIKWLQGLCNIYIDKFRCPKTYWEFVSYEYEQDRDGNFISSYPDFNNHSIDSCLVGNTEILTKNGYVKIKDIVGTTGILYAYDIENESVVESEYCHCRKTREDAEIWLIELDDGRTIECTYDHKILTTSGYIIASKLVEDNIVICIDTPTKVKRVAKTDRKEDVYDLEVPKYHNFVLKNGAVVHNCRYAMEKFYKRRGN